MDKKTKISKNREYRKIYNRGKSMASATLVTYVLKNRLPVVRLGITTSKKIGNAVKRNRARRVIRAAFFGLRTYIPNGGYDIIFVARSKTCQVKSDVVLDTMKHHLEKLGVID